MNILEYENYHENVTHADIIFPYNTYLCSIPLDFTTVPLHWHDEVELVYIKKGRGNLTVDFREYPVSGPSLVLILPGQLHSICQEPGESMEYENIIFHPNMLLSRQNDVTATEFLLPLLHGTLSVPTLYTPQDPYYTEVIAAIDACDEISKTKPKGFELYIKSRLYQFFYVLCSRCRDSERVKAGNRKTLDKMKIILKYIEHHYMDKITIADIAAEVQFSESHFMRYFKKTMGTTFTDYLKDYRLTMAARLLTTSDSTVLAIAGETGFDNLSYFNRSFKKKYALTPREFRAMEGMSSTSAIEETRSQPPRRSVPQQPRH